MGLEQPPLSGAWVPEVVPVGGRFDTIEESQPGLGASVREVTIAVTIDQKSLVEKDRCSTLGKTDTEVRAHECLKRTHVHYFC